MNIIFFGSSDESIQLLDEISKDHTILAIVSKPLPKNSKRRKFTNPKLFEYTNKNNTPNKNNTIHLHPIQIDKILICKNSEDIIKQLFPK